MKDENGGGVCSSSFRLHPTSLINWYRANRRDLPWRVASGFPDPYQVLLSELMLQQTQVTTVIGYFRRFIERFPTLTALAAADEQEVLRLWQGLGYYSRARNLHRAAKEIIARHGGLVPKRVEELLELPGIGRYTAGAIASLAYGVRAPILDGNVQRVLCRLKAMKSDPRQPKVRALLWETAEAMLPDEQVADFNSGLMELGAMICTPRNPQCDVCPVRRFCAAADQGLQERIPLAKKAKERPVERRWVFCIERDRRWLIEQRPDKGRWAGMWQLVTVEAGEARPDAALVKRLCGVSVKSLVPLGEVKHDLTHRHYEFAAYRCRFVGNGGLDGRRWAGGDELASYPMSRPQLAIMQMALGGLGKHGDDS